jgi:hypothetical protein
MKELLSKNELIKKFKEQLQKLETFNKLFDEGDESIAAEMAVKMRVLFYNSNSSKSLLRQLKLTDIQFVDTSSRYSSRNLLTHLGLLLTEAKFTQEGIVSKVLIKHDLSDKRLIDFHNWWDNKVVVSDKYNKTFTRRRLILELANTDGGAHVDDKLKQDYWKLTRENSVNWFIQAKGGVQVPIDNPVPKCIRQISHEVLLTFNKIDVEKTSKVFDK